MLRRRPAAQLQELCVGTMCDNDSICDILEFSAVPSLVTDKPDSPHCSCRR
jgi:hypothetical protein